MKNISIEGLFDFCCFLRKESFFIFYCSSFFLLFFLSRYFSLTKMDGRDLFFLFCLYSSNVAKVFLHIENNTFKVNEANQKETFLTSWYNYFIRRIRWAYSFPFNYWIDKTYLEISPLFSSISFKRNPISTYVIKSKKISKKSSFPP